MRKGWNIVMVAGNLGRDPEVRFGAGGNAVCKLSVGVGYRRKDGEQWVDEVEWVPVAVFGRSAENAGQFLSKGSEVLVRGRLKTSSWEKDGEKRYRTEVVAEDLTFLGGRRDGATKAARPTQDDGFNDDDNFGF